MIGAQTTQLGPQYLVPTTRFEPDRLIIRTYDWMTVQAAEVDLVINQGAEFRQRIIWADAEGQPRDLTGWSALMPVRQQFADAEPLLTITPLIHLEASDYEIRVDVPAATTAAYTGWSRALYNLLLINDTRIVRLMQGSIELSPGMTVEVP